MPKSDNPSFATLAALTAEHEDLVSRLAAPLWSRVGRPMSGSDLSWAISLLGEDGPHLLSEALRGFDAFDPRTGALSARGLLRFLASLLGDDPMLVEKQPQSPELVWTLPYSHAGRAVRGQTYLKCCLQLIGAATRSLTIVSPFIDPAGIGAIEPPLLAALARKVVVRLLVHDALNIGTPTSRALESLRREAERTGANLSVFSSEAGTGGDRLFNPLFHAKLVIRDNHALLLGSANLTSFGLGSNFEAGVLLGEAAAREALFIVDGILRTNTIYLVFKTEITRRQLA